MNGKKKLILACVVFLCVFLIGVAGFKIIGGQEWGWLDSLYMTVITLSTVGYGETIDISANPAARLFVVVFIIFCLGTIAFAVSSITTFIVEGELKDLLGRRRMEKKIARLKDHYIVCGSGETSLSIIQELLLTKRKFVVVDPQKENLEKLEAMGDILYINGDPAEDDVLIAAGIERAKGILLSLPSDEANLFVTVTARGLNPKIRIVSKGIDLRSHKKILKAGSNAVISPPHIGGMRMVSEMVRPAVVTFLDMMLRDRQKALRFEEIPIGTDSPLAGKTIQESRIREKTGGLVVAVKRSDSGEFEFNPDDEARLQPRDILILIVTPKMTKEIARIAGAD